jgi:hypothetical protein
MLYMLSGLSDPVLLGVDVGLLVLTLCGLVGMFL